jgi:probable O-glycosylation ligase (exosortase A-associated)
MRSAASTRAQAQGNRLGGHAGARAIAAVDNAVSAAKPTTLLFCGYLMLVLLEYTGITRNLLPFLQALRLSTVLAYILLIAVIARVGFKDTFRYRQTRILVALTLFTIASVAWAVVQTYAFQAIRVFVDYTVLFFLTLSLVDRRKRIDALSWTFVAVSVYVVVLNLNTLGAATRNTPFKAGRFMADGNDFAWTLVIMLPLILNLCLGRRLLLTRVGGLVGVASCLMGIVGTSSRGATLGLAAMALYYLVAISRRKLLTVMALAAIGGGVLILAPSTYFERMETIADYQEDNSATARLQTWSAAIKMAIDYPLGVGADNFPSAYGRFYIPQGDANAIGWGSGRWLSAHSIYFRTLGEYGFLGLGLLLWLIIGNFRDNVVARRVLTANPDKSPVPPVWPGLVAMAVIGHAVCGAFLAGLPYPHLFLLSALTIVNRRLSAPFVVASPRGRVMPPST